ncbi:hypothetical protein KCV07_g7872, partial [Aureobasidium melanogenum]
MPAAAQPQSAPDLRQANPFESSYNQLCGGEGAQEWAEFEASLFRAYSDQTQTDEQSISQGQQHKQNSAMLTGRQASLRANLDQSHMLRHSELSRDVLPQQKQAATNKDKEQSTSKEPIAGFHCPWVDCHSRLQMWTDYIRSTNDPDSFQCVHTGCKLEFAAEEVWRKHVLTAHHNLVPTVQPVGEADMEAAWEKIQT